MLPFLPIDRPQYSSNLSVFFCVFYAFFNTDPLSFLQHLPCLINFSHMVVGLSQCQVELHLLVGIQAEVWKF